MSSFMVQKVGCLNLDTVPDLPMVDKPEKEKLLDWLSQFDKVELWSDCLSFDWVLLSELIADRSNGYPKLPDNFEYHSPFDILTLFKANGADYDVTREKFAFGEYIQEMKNKKHNALWDAKVIKACYNKLSAT